MWRLFRYYTYISSPKERNKTILGTTLFKYSLCIICHGGFSETVRHQETKIRTPALLLTCRDTLYKMRWQNWVAHSFFNFNEVWLWLQCQLLVRKTATFRSLTSRAALKEWRRTHGGRKRAVIYGGRGEEGRHLALTIVGEIQTSKTKVFCSQSKVTEVAGRGPDAKEDTAAAKLKEKETWYPAAPALEQWLLVKCFKLWQGWRGDRPGVHNVDMVLPSS